MENYDQPSGGIVAAILGIFLIPLIVITVILIISHWKIYTKAGKPGWATLIPFYNVIVLLEIIGKPWWWLFLILIPCTSLIFAIWATNLLSKSFGQKEGFTVGLLLLPYVFYPILAFGNYQYLGPSAKEAGGFKPFDPSTDYKDPFNTNPPQA